MNMRFHIIVLASVLLCSCNQHWTTDLGPFLKDSTVRLEIDGERAFVYDAVDCQLSFNEKRLEFGAHTDTMLDYFILYLDAIPTKTGDMVNARIIWSTPAGEKSKTNITLHTKRIQGDVIWLCDKGCRNAAVVRVLE